MTDEEKELITELIKQLKELNLTLRDISADTGMLAGTSIRGRL